MRITGSEDHFDSSGAVIEIKDLVPSLAAIAGAKNAAFGVWAVSMAEGGNVNDIGICGVNDECADVASVAEADVGPGLARIGGFVDSVAIRNVAANACFTRSSVETSECM